MSSICMVGLGGAVGAIGRYCISLLPIKTSFPYLTLLTNLLGAILIGFIVGIAAVKSEPNPQWLLFWKTGVCGGFTTFSTFSLEALALMQDKHPMLSGIYIVSSVVLCLLGVAVGQALALHWIKA